MPTILPRLLLAATLLLPSAASAQVSSHALTESSGASNQYAGTPSAGTVQGAATTSVTGVVAGAGNTWLVGQAYNGTSQYAQLPTVAGTSNTVTYVANWLATGTISGFDGILFCRGSDVCGMHVGDAGGREIGYTWDGLHFDWNSGVIAPFEEWCMVAVVVEPTKATVYCFHKDGTVQRAVNTATHSAALYAQSPQVGADSTVARFTPGWFNNARIYNSALTEAQLQAIWNGWLPALNSATVATNGTSTALTLAGTPTSLPAGAVTVKQDGIPVAVSATSGATTSWTASHGVRWLRSGSTITVTLGNSTVTATNNSTITQRRVQYPGLGFGMMVHWGPSTHNNTDLGEPSTPASSFAPTESISDCIDNHIAVAKSAGCNYIVLTAKHWDGFCLWPTDTTDYDVTAAGLGDIIRLYTEKCRAAGLKVGIYYCVRDGNFQADNPGFTSAQYEDYFHDQLTELLTRYGPIDYLWLDGWGWVGSTIVPMFSDGVGSELAIIPFAPVRTLVTTYQPNCTLGVNSHEHTLDNTDVSIWEVPVEGEIDSANALPAETTETIRQDDFWFEKDLPGEPLTSAQILTLLSNANARRGSLLLNVPPDTTGKIPAHYARVMADVGANRLEAVPPPIIRGSIFGGSR